ncbi:MAG: ACP S-malonyltransferase [Verrucomicrobia bacterium]|nr:ACP S-malonyltransferase [Verrucomicrobiota bacterium]
MPGSAVVFAGQGAQAVGMARDLAEAMPECRAVFDAADEALGYALSSICFDGPDEELTRSNHCQPGIFVASAACYRALTVRDGAWRPALAAGLSLGEWTALYAAGAVSFVDALTALEARGRFMQEACEEHDGSMVSIIGLDAAACATIADQAGVEVANLNSPEQTVLSGTRQGIESAAALATEAGAKRAIVLNVAGAFHSRLMQSAADRLTDVLATIPFTTPTVPVLSNVTGKPHGNPAAIREALVKQVTQPVQWVGCIEAAASAGIDSYVECGPGRVLSSLIKRIQPDAKLANVQDAASLEKTVAALAADG